MQDVIPHLENPYFLSTQVLRRTMTMLKRTIIPVIDMTPVSIFSSPKLVLKRWQKTLYVRNEATQRETFSIGKVVGFKSPANNPGPVELLVYTHTADFTLQLLV